MIKVLIADDQAMVRAGLRSLLSGEPDLQVVAEVADGSAAVAAVRAHEPDVVLMDIRMPVLDGISATRQLASEECGTRVLILTTYDLDQYVYDALRAGASGFLLKDATPEELARAVRVVASGEALLAPSVTSRLVRDLSSRPRRRVVDDARIARLTDREREVLVLVAGGLSNAELAERLVVSPATAKTHVSRILTKLGARDRAQLVVLAYEAGLVSPGGGAARPPLT